jgi:hypothetical protein
MDGNPILIIKGSDFISKKKKENRFSDDLFHVLQYHIMHILCHVPTQVIRPMIPKHVLEFDKAK